MKKSALCVALICVLSTPLSALSQSSKAAKPSPSSLQASSSPVIDVYKSPTCGCCVKWVDHLKASGLKVRVHDERNMTAFKDTWGVPNNKRSCHTATAGGYFIEGHVPASDIKTLLRDKPKAKGLAVAGMPLGSPGMEMNGVVQPYTVDLIEKNGTVRVYRSYKK